MNVEMDLDLMSVDMILQQHGLNKSGPVQRKFTMDVKRFCEPYVPMGEQKALINNAIESSDYESIVYNTPYAHYMYEGKLMVDPVTGNPYAPKHTQKVYATPTVDFDYNGAPNRGKHWEKRMWADRGEEILDSLQKFVDRGGK